MLSRRPAISSSSLRTLAAGLAAVLVIASLATAETQPPGEAAAAAKAQAGAAAGKPVRVASLVTFATDALSDMPEKAIVVASVRRSMHEPPKEGIIDLGSPHRPSFEQLAAARPDIIVGDVAFHASRKGDLERFGAEVVLLDSTSLSSTFDSLRKLGKRVNAEKEMDAKVGKAEEAVGSLALTEPLATLPLFGTPASFLVVTDRAWLGDLLRRLNFQNLGAESTGRESVPGYAEVSDEKLVELRPKLVLLVAHGDGDRIRSAFERKLDSSAWQGVRKANTAGVHVLDPNLFGSNPGLAMPEAARQLRALAKAPASGS